MAEIAQPHDAFLKNWNPAGKVAMDAAQIEGIQPLNEDQKIVKEEVKKDEPKKDDKPAETPPVKAEEKKPEDSKEAKPADSSLKSGAEAPIEEKKPTDSSVKTFEQLLEEKSAGKFKTYEELVAQIEKEQPKHEYKSALAQKLDAYVEAGGSEEDFTRTQSVDFTKMDTRELLEYKIQMEDPDMTQEEIDYELDKRYNISKWNTDPAEFESEAEKKEIQFAKLRAERESKKTQAELIAEQQKWAVPEKKKVEAPVVDPKVQEKWNLESEASVAKLEKYPLKITEKDSYDLLMDSKDKSDITQLTKDLFVNGNAFWDKMGVRYKDTDGSFKINKEKLSEVMYKAMSFDKAIKFATTEASNRAKEALVKDELKNVDMKPGDAKPSGEVKLTPEEAKKAAIQKEAARVAKERAGVK